MRSTLGKRVQRVERCEGSNPSPSVGGDVRAFWISWWWGIGVCLLVGCVTPYQKEKQELTQANTILKLKVHNAYLERELLKMERTLYPATDE